MRVAHIDMTKPAQIYPNGYALHGQAPRSCGRISDQSCDSGSFTSKDIQEVWKYVSLLLADKLLD